MATNRNKNASIYPTPGVQPNDQPRILAIKPYHITRARMLLFRLPRPRLTLSIAAVIVLSLCAWLYVFQLRQHIAAPGQAWIIRPHYAIHGTNDVQDPCAMQKIVNDSYSCKFYFNNYPGYLSQESQKLIETKITSDHPAFTGPYSQPIPFITITVAKQTDVLKRYRIHGNTCDIKNLREVADTSAKYQINDAFVHKPEPRACGQIVTDGGTKLYYDLPRNSQDNVVDVPMAYYFTKKDAIVTIQLSNEPVLAGSATAYYFTDPGFQPELYKFIDGF
ncbi:MAG TPA: hypothetical protein VLE73_06380 [Candidatus Saccharimonadales bacterium]|nr:hypothetical protein [Candidatus Saccharimonadales bacterium]